MNTNSVPSLWSNGFAPLGELKREMDRLLDSGWDDIWVAPTRRGLRNLQTTWQPTYDVEESENHFLVSLDLPGVPKDQIKVEVEDGQLTVSGERRSENKRAENGTWHTERSFGKFHRSFALPSGIDAGAVEGNYQDGVLRLLIPKPESAKPRQIKITNGSN